MPKQPTPRKGTETNQASYLVLICLETTHTPQGDGNHISLIGIGLVDGMKQPTPRKGTETVKVVYHRVRSGNNPHPARGRKPARRRDSLHAPEKQPTPRKGTETSFKYHFPRTLLQKQPTPRKGTETQPFCLANVASEKQPTPRKGTETLYCSAPAAHSRGNNPHPARGRKPIVMSVEDYVIGNNPHPARGRKLPRPEPKDSQDGNNPHPARGRKLI